MSERAEAAAGEALPSAPVLRLDPGMHTAMVRRIDVDAAGRFLVTGSDDRTVRLWSVEDGTLLRTLRVPLGEGDVGKVFAVAISPDGARVAAGGWGPGSSGDDQSIYVFERASGRLTGRVDGLPNVVYHLAFSPDGRHLVVGGANGIRVFESERFTEVARDADYGDSSYWSAFDRAGRLATTCYDGKLRLYDPGFRLIRSVPAPGGARPFAIAFSPDGTRLAVGYDDSTRVDVLDGVTLEHLLAADTSGVDNGDLSKVAWSADGRFLYAGGRWIEAGKKLRRWADPHRTDGAYRDLALSQNTIMDLRPLEGGRITFGAADPALGVLGGDGTVLWRHDPAQADFRGQNNVLAVSTTGKRVRFGFWLEPDALFDLAARRLTIDPEPDASLATARTDGLPVEDWKNETDPTLDGEPLPLEPLETSRSLAIAPDGERFLLGADWSLRLFDRTGEETWRVPVPGAAWAVAITGDGRLALAAFGDGTIRWYRLEDGRELLAFFPHGDRERWVAWTPEGYYLAAPGGDDLIGWHVNRGLDRAPEFYGAARFRDRFHRPDVVALVLDELDVERAVARAARESDLEPRAREDLEDILPPVIEIIEPADGTSVEGAYCTVTYWLESPVDEPVRRVKALLDDRVVAEEMEPPVQEAGLEGCIAVRMAGENPTLTLIAEGARASDPVSVRLRWRGAIIGERVKPVLRVLAVGISQYGQHEHLKLNYAAQDAKDFVDATLRQEGGLYRRVEVRRLLDDEAVWEEIVEGFDWLERSLSARDVGIVFLAGHGANDRRGDFHFLPHDVNVATDITMRKTGLGYQDIKSTLKVLAERGKALFFLDACHSGGLARGGDLPPDIDTVASDLAQAENGVIVFTSSTGRELSREDPAWENGAFTEALLEALAGRAAGDDGYVSIHGLQGYLPKRVRALTKDAQNPQIHVPDGRVRDFKLALVR